MITFKTRRDLTRSLRTLRTSSGAISNFTSVGCYTLAFVCHDGEMAHPACVRKNLKDALSRHAGDRFVACGTYDEGPTETCLYCDGAIESSYGDPEEQES